MNVEDPDQNKSKSNKKSAAKTGSGIKRKNKVETKGKSCLLFLSKVVKKFGHKKKSPKSSDVIECLLDEITNALPLGTSSNTSKIILKPEATTVLYPEIIENIPMENINARTEGVEITELNTSTIDENDDNLKLQQDLEPQTSKWVDPKPKSAKPRASKSKLQIKEKVFVMPHMPLTNSDVFKKQEEIRLTQKLNVKMEDAASNTRRDRNTAEEIHKHVDTLRKISIIADEFNKKTAKNLKDIIHSVQLDLLKRLDDESKDFGNASTSETNPALPIN